MRTFSVTSSLEVMACDIGTAACWPKLLSRGRAFKMDVWVNWISQGSEHYFLLTELAMYLEIV